MGSYVALLLSGSVGLHHIDAMFSMKLGEGHTKGGAVLPGFFQRYRWHLEYGCVPSPEDIANSHLQPDVVILDARIAATPAFGLFEIDNSIGGTPYLKKRVHPVRRKVISLSEEWINLDTSSDCNLEILKRHSLILEPKPADCVLKP